jgi:hypothetical protein
MHGRPAFLNLEPEPSASYGDISQYGQISCLSVRELEFSVSILYVGKTWPAWLHEHRPTGDTVLHEHVQEVGTRGTVCAWERYVHTSIGWVSGHPNRQVSFVTSACPRTISLGTSRIPTRLFLVINRIQDADVRTISTNMKGIGRSDALMDRVVQDRDKWRPLMDRAMQPQIPENVGKILSWETGSVSRIHVHEVT